MVVQPCPNLWYHKNRLPSQENFKWDYYKILTAHWQPRYAQSPTKTDFSGMKSSDPDLDIHPPLNSPTSGNQPILAGDISNLRQNKNLLITFLNIMYNPVVLPYNNLTTGGPQWIPLTDPPSTDEVAGTGAALLVLPDWPIMDLKKEISSKEDQLKKDGVIG